MYQALRHYIVIVKTGYNMLKLKHEEKAFIIFAFETERGVAFQRNLEFCGNLKFWLCYRVALHP